MMEMETTNPNGLPQQRPACLSCQETRLMVEGMNTKLNQVIELVGAIKDEVEPALKGIADSPVGTMLGMKKRM